MAFSSRALNLSCFVFLLGACGRAPAGGSETSSGTGETDSESTVSEVTSVSSDDSWSDSYCVAQGSAVSTPIGDRAIEDLALGDLVYAVDPKTGELLATPVTFIRSAVRRVLELQIEGGTRLRVTEDHPVYSPDHDSYANAGHWRSGELTHVLVVDTKGTYRRRVEHVEVAETDTIVYDIGVAHDLHNFVASEVLVHNKSVATYETDDWDGSESSFTPPDLDQGCGTQCDIWQADDCPEGQKCTAVGCEEGTVTWDSYVCRDIQGTGMPGDECQSTDGQPLSGNDTCEGNSMCFGISEDTGMGTCLEFCGPPDDYVCTEGSSCSISGNSILALCIPNCDPLALDCDEGESCLPYGTGAEFTCVQGSEPFDKPYGEPCETNTCEPGLMCADATLVPEPACEMATGCCTPFCDLNTMGTCPGVGQECLSYWGPGTPPPGYEHLGVCVLP